MLLLLVRCDDLDHTIDLLKQRVVSKNTTLMPCIEYVLIVIFELFVANSTIDMLGARFWLFDKLWALFCQRQLL